MDRGYLAAGALALLLAGCSSGSGKQPAKMPTGSHADGVAWSVAYMNAHCGDASSCATAAVEAQAKLAKQYGSTAATSIYQQSISKMSDKTKANLVGAMGNAADAVMACQKKYPDMNSDAYNKCMDKIP